MKMEKKTQPIIKTQNIYMVSLVITVVIFILGLLVGFSIERFLLANLENRASVIETSIQEIELELLYFQSLDIEDSCSFLKEIARKTNNKLDIFANQLSGYSKDRILFTRGEVSEIKTKYTLLLVKDWILQEKIRSDCNASVVSVLYFYSTDSCDECILQGDILTILKESLRDKLMVFPLDTEIEYDMIDILMTQFNITYMPSLVIDGVTYDGIMSKGQLTEIICEKLPDIEQCAQG